MLVKAVLELGVASGVQQLAFQRLLAKLIEAADELKQEGIVTAVYEAKVETEVAVRRLCLLDK